MPKPRKAIYPGTFDPITIGHLDIIERALHVVDELVVAVADDMPKTPLFSLKERAEMVKETLKPFKYNSRVKIVPFKGLLVHFAEEQGASIIIRGLRAVSDFEYEFQLASMNNKLSPHLETIFLPASENVQFIASRFVKEIARLGGDISALVPECVVKRMGKKV